MQIIRSLPELLGELWRHIGSRRRRQFGLLSILMVLTSFTEILGIGSILPFLAILTSPDRVFEHHAAQSTIQFFGITSAEQLLLPITIAFGLIALLAGVMRLLLLWASTRLSFAMGMDLSVNIYRRTLYQPYTVHVARNSSEVINGISGKTNTVINSVIVPTLTLISAGIMLVAILIALIIIDPVIALVAFGGFGAIYTLIIRLARKQLMVDSQCIASESTNVIKSLP